MMIYLLVSVLCAGPSAVLAQMKGRSTEVFFAWGLIFGVFGLAYAVFADTAHARHRMGSKLATRPSLFGAAFATS